MSDLEIVELPTADAELEAALDRLMQALGSPVTFLAWAREQSAGKSLGTVGSGEHSPLAHYLQAMSQRHLGVASHEVCVYGPLGDQTAAGRGRTQAIVPLPLWAQGFNRAIAEVARGRVMAALDAILLAPQHYLDGGRWARWAEHRRAYGAAADVHQGQDRRRNGRRA